MNTKNMNYYEILGVPLDATVEEIRKAYLELVRRYHPDVYKGEDAEEKIKAINIAYDTLFVSKKRSMYDKVNNVTQNKSTNSENDGFDFYNDDYYNVFIKTLELQSKAQDLYNELNNIIDSIDDGNISALSLLETWQEKVNQFSDKYLKSNIKSTFIDDLLNYMNKKAKQYQKIDPYVLNGIVTTGKYVLNRINRIKGIIIKYPQNKKIITLCEHLEELVDNYINEVDFASQSDFDYNQLSFVLDSTLEMRLIESECSNLLFTDYLNILDKKKELQKQYNTELINPITEITCITLSIFVATCGAYYYYSKNQKEFLPIYLLIMGLMNWFGYKDVIEVLFNKIKYHKEVKENKIKIKKLDGFIDAYHNRIK